MYRFCTYFDKNYLLQGVTLYRSLVANCTDFCLFVLCLDDDVYSIINQLQLENLVPISLHEVESWDERLLIAKGNHSQIEYYFTLSPILPLFLFDRFPAIDLITYLDADLYFYADPQPIFSDLGNRSIAIVAHKFPDHLKKHEINGRFNVQCQVFRRDEQGYKCLERWRDQCLSWCYDRLEGDKFADQKYLNEWPTLYDGLVILQHKGVGLAPWNWSSYRIELDEKQARIDGQPLIFYHFHGLKILSECLIIDGTAPFVRMTQKYLQWFYGEYIKELKSTIHWLSERDIQWSGSFFSDFRYGKTRLKVLLEGWLRRRLTKIC